MSLTVDSANNISGYLTSQFGLAIATANRKVVYSSMDVTWNQVDYFLVPAGGSVSNTYSALIKGAERITGTLFGFVPFSTTVSTYREVLVAQVLINPPPLTRRSIAHSVSVNGSVVSVSGGSEDAFILVLMR